MTHTTVELGECSVDINTDNIQFKIPDRTITITYDQFDEILEAVARMEKFTDT
jgi:hypothetical protein